MAAHPPTTACRILFVSDDPTAGMEWARSEAAAGCTVRTCTYDKFMDSLARARADAVVFHLPPSLEAIRSWQSATSPPPAAVLVTAQAGTAYLSQALGLGIDQVILPWDHPASLRLAIDMALLRHGRRDSAPLRPAGVVPPPPNEGALGTIIGESPAITAVKQQALQVASLNSTVLLVGETGTGKELFARGIHAASPRAGGPLVAVNVAALPDQLLESELFGYVPGAFTGASREGKKGKILQADGGTLFLDEVGDLPLPLQVKLLRVLQEREVEPVGALRPIPIDVRIIAATHRDLAQMVQDGLFREDLFHRLAVITIHLPPLRERKGDVPLLATTFLRQLCERYGGSPKFFTRAALGVLEAYEWPGNVRELQNVVEHLYVTTRDQEILAEDVLRVFQLRRVGTRRAAAPASAAGRAGEGRGLAESVERAEREAIIKALQATGGNKREAARLMGLSHQTFYNRLYKYGLM